VPCDWDVAGPIRVGTTMRAMRVIRTMRVLASKSVASLWAECRALPGQSCERASSSRRRTWSCPNKSPATTIRPSADTAHDASAASAWQLARTAPMVMSQTRTVPSLDPETAVRPSAAIATALTHPVPFEYAHLAGGEVPNPHGAVVRPKCPSFNLDSSDLAANCRQFSDLEIPARAWPSS
jgi:hypothetical protein